MKTKNTSKALVTVTPLETVQHSVVPKPTQNEVVEALARIRYQEIKTEREAAEINQKKALEIVSEKIRKWVIKSIKTLPIVIKKGNMWNDKLNYAEAEISLAESMPEDLKSELISYHKFKIPVMQDIKEIKREIRESISQSPVGMEARVSALITNPVTKSALCKMLIELGVSEDSKAISV